uniref:CSON003337 protein n=1 Tax=Culicoides sonorensis TaxID=179676 RepID=A0A336LMC8_CULSO
MKKALGLSLSGCEQEATTNRELENELKISYPNVTKSYMVVSDTVDSIKTASNLGGLVLIAGIIMHFYGTTTYVVVRWIAQRAIKTVFDHEDNFIPSPYPIERVWQIICKYFNIETRLDLLPYCYGEKFDKSFYAGLCKKLAEAAEDGDELCLKVFTDAGYALDKSLLALLPKVEAEFVSSGSLIKVYVGSVWLS